MALGYENPLLSPDEDFLLKIETCTSLVVCEAIIMALAVVARTRYFKMNLL